MGKSSGKQMNIPKHISFGAGKPNNGAWLPEIPAHSDIVKVLQDHSYHCTDELKRLDAYSWHNRDKKGPHMEQQMGSPRRSPPNCARQRTPRRKKDLPFRPVVHRLKTPNYHGVQRRDDGASRRGTSAILRFGHSSPFLCKIYKVPSSHLSSPLWL